MTLRRAAGYLLVVAATAAAGCATSPAPRRAVASLPSTSAGPPRHTRALAAPPVLPAHTFAYSMVGSAVVATAYRVPGRTKAEGPITVVRFDPAHTRLVLHAGSAQPSAGMTWRYGPVVRSGERHLLVAAFNGGFKMRDARGGWMSEGRTIRHLVRGAASVVIYADGGVDVGAWGRDVPMAGRRVAAVRQNLQLLVDHGLPRLIHPPDQSILDRWWGHAFLEQPLIARSALGITADGSVVWAAGTDITVAALANALLGAGVVRAMELDVNAPLVRGFLYAGIATVVSHRRARAILPLVVGQRQLRHDPGLRDSSVAPHCTYLSPCSRDFFTVLAR